MVAQNQEKRDVQIPKKKVINQYSSAVYIFHRIAKNTKVNPTIPKDRRSSAFFNLSICAKCSQPDLALSSLALPKDGVPSTFPIMYAIPETNESFKFSDKVDFDILLNWSEIILLK